MDHYLLSIAVPTDPDISNLPPDSAKEMEVVLTTPPASLSKLSSSSMDTSHDFEMPAPMSTLLKPMSKIAHPIARLC